MIIVTQVTECPSSLIGIKTGTLDDQYLENVHEFIGTVLECPIVRIYHQSAHFSPDDTWLETLDWNSEQITA